MPGAKRKSDTQVKKDALRSQGGPSNGYNTTKKSAALRDSLFQTKPGSPRARDISKRLTSSEEKDADLQNLDGPKEVRDRYKKDIAAAKSDSAKSMKRLRKDKY